MTGGLLHAHCSSANKYSKVSRVQAEASWEHQAKSIARVPSEQARQTTVQTCQWSCECLASPLLQGIRLSCCSLLGQTQKTFIAAFLAPAPNQDVSRTAKDGGRGGDAGGSTTPPKCSVRPLAAHRRADAQPGLHLPPHAIPLLSPLWPTARVWNVRDPAVLEGPCTPTAPAWRSPHRLPLAHPIP